VNKAEKYVEKVRQWACTEDKILALALVGSHARQQARPDSDIDFVIISDNIALLEKNVLWLNRFGTVKRQAKEKWGNVTTIRVFYTDGQEIEFGLTSKSWAAIPVNAGTIRVVADGIVILKDPDKILDKLKAAVLKDNYKKLPGIKINPVTAAEIDSVMALVKGAIEKMEREGIHQWDEIYPTKENFLADTAVNSLFAARVKNMIAGVIALNEIQSPEYESITWVDSNGNPLIIHRLCVSPGFQGQGLAKKLMFFAEKYAQEKKYSSIRLDAFVHNTISVGLYNSLGYQRRGSVKFRKGDFYCFEKLLQGDSD
jgi:ribosomal protein S18 acetylase RimI-like enzyme